MLPISCLPHWTLRCDGLMLWMLGTRCWLTPWGLFVTCRTIWWRRLKRHCRKHVRRRCCYTWWMLPIRIDENIAAVNEVLAEIEADEIPVLLVMNKIDMLDGFVPRIDRNEENVPVRVWLSAQTGDGISLLFQVLTERLSEDIAHYSLSLPPQAGRLRSRFYQLQAIEKEWIEEDGRVGLIVRMPMVDWRRLCKQEQELADYVV